MWLHVSHGFVLYLSVHKASFCSETKAYKNSLRGSIPAKWPFLDSSEIMTLWPFTRLLKLQVFGSGKDCVILQNVYGRLMSGFRVHVVFHIAALLRDPFTLCCNNCLGYLNSRVVDIDSRIVYRWLCLKWALLKRAHCHFACCVFCCSKSALGAVGGLTAIYTVPTLQWHSSPLPMHSCWENRQDCVL